MITPAYEGSGTGVSVGSSPGTFNYPSGVVEGDLLLFQVGTTRDSDVIYTPGGWTKIAGPNAVVGLGNQWVFGKIARASEPSTLTVAWTAIGRAIFQMYRISNGILATTTPTLATGTTATAADEGVTTDRNNMLALNFVHTARGNQTIPAFTGETGGDWVTGVNYGDGVDPDSNTIQIQHAAMATAGTINGGTCSLASAVAWAVIGLGVYSSSNDVAWLKA